MNASMTRHNLSLSINTERRTVSRSESLIIIITFKNVSPITRRQPAIHIYSIMIRKNQLAISDCFYNRFVLIVG